MNKLNEPNFITLYSPNVIDMIKAELEPVKGHFDDRNEEKIQIKSAIRMMNLLLEYWEDDGEKELILTVE